MGFLDQLWDDSLAGPCPDTGLAKLRKITVTDSSMATVSTPVGEEALSRLRKCRANAAYNQRSNDEARQVKQGITIIKPPGYLRSLSLDSPSSPAVLSPSMDLLLFAIEFFINWRTLHLCLLDLEYRVTVTPPERENPWRSNKQKKGCEKSPRAEPRSPTVYDWVVIIALDG